MNGKVPETVGTPEIRPAEGIGFRPAGSGPVPGVTRVQVYGPTPPVAAKLKLYEVPCVPDGTDVVVMVNPALIGMLKSLLAVCAVGTEESVAVNVNGVVAATVGVPVIAPVLAFSDKPAGSVVGDVVQVTGGVPPVVCRNAPV